MNAKYKKSLKIVTLLITSLIIATVAADTYVYMYINGSVTVGTAQLVWIAGTDAPGSTVINGGTVTLPLTVQPGVNQNFTEALFLKNQDSADHNMTVTVTTAITPAGDFDIANAYIYGNSTGSWVYVDTLTLTSASDQYSTYTGNTPLTAGNYYRFTFEIQAKTSATGPYSFVLQLVYE
jgi:hypothetical protein